MSRRAAVLALPLLTIGGFLAGGVVRRDTDGRGARPELSGATASLENRPAGTEGIFFRELVDKVRREYVDIVPSDPKLATGGVKGMVGSLDDPDSTYMDAPAFAAARRARVGEVEGIGATLSLVIAPGKKVSTGGTGTPEEVLATVPAVARLVVTNVLPGGPAAGAGVKIGDAVYSVDGRWLVNTDLLVRFRQAQRRFELKQIPLKELNALRKEIRDKSERAMLPLKARDKLAVGTVGTVEVEWERGATRRTTRLTRALVKRSSGGRVGTTLRLPVTKAGIELLKARAGATTLDLRGLGEGDAGSMKVLLPLLAPSGNYGVLRRNPARGNEPLKISKGDPNAPVWTVLVDRSVRGPAQILARALASQGRARLQGNMDSAARVTELIDLPGGEGYSLAVAEYALPKGGAK